MGPHHGPLRNRHPPLKLPVAPQSFVEQRAPGGARPRAGTRRCRRPLRQRSAGVVAARCAGASRLVGPGGGPTALFERPSRLHCAPSQLVRQFPDVDERVACKGSHRRIPHGPHLQAETENERQAPRSIQPGRGQGAKHNHDHRPFSVRGLMLTPPPASGRARLRRPQAAASRGGAPGRGGRRRQQQRPRRLHRRREGR